MRTVLGRLRRVVRPSADDCPDARLLAGFLSRRDGDAFAALVGRHGPLVRGVCRRLLTDSHDADDAFQATFLVLVRRAAALARPDLLGPWLYAVAVRTARSLRARQARRLARLVPLPDLPAPDPPAAAEPDLRDRLDSAVRGLPEKYRQPVVLCLMQGLTRKEAAQRLGCPEGTLSARLARGRRLLRRRLGGLAAGTLTAALAGAGSASVPAELADGTVRAALIFANDPSAAGALPPAVAALTQGVLAMDRMRRLAAVALGLALVLGLGGGLGLFLGQPAPGDLATAGCGPTLAPPADKPASTAAVPALTVVVRDGDGLRLTVREGDDEVTVNTAAALTRYLKRVRKDLANLDTLTVQAGATARFQSVEPVVVACRDAGFSQIKFEIKQALDPQPQPAPATLNYDFGPRTTPAVEARPPAPVAPAVPSAEPPLPVPSGLPTQPPVGLPPPGPGLVGLPTDVVGGPPNAPPVATEQVIPPQAAPDLDRFQGLWKGVIEVEGKEDDVEIEAVVSGDRLFLTMPDIKDGAAVVYRIRLDPRNPDGMDLIGRKDGKEFRVPCLYSLADETWRLARPKDPNGPRPRDFRNRKNKAEVIELKRAPAENSPAPGGNTTN
jgi:RNA polymerase sigma factor (sigma-70 family)